MRLQFELNSRLVSWLLHTSLTLSLSLFHTRVDYFIPSSSPVDVVVARSRRVSLSRAILGIKSAVCDVIVTFKYNSSDAQWLDYYDLYAKNTNVTLRAHTDKPLNMNFVFSQCKVYLYTYTHKVRAAILARAIYLYRYLRL